MSIELTKINGQSSLDPPNVLRSVEYHIEFPCESTTNAILTWRNSSNSPFPNGKMSVTVNTNQSMTYNISDVIPGYDTIDLSWKGIVDFRLELTASKIESSTLTVEMNATAVTDIVRKDVQIARNCTSGNRSPTHIWDIKKTQHSYKENSTIDCRILTNCSGKSADKGKMLMLCGVDGNWIQKQFCVVGAKLVGISPGSSDTSDLAKDSSAIFQCNDRSKYSSVVVGYDQSSSNETFEIKSINIDKHHGKTIMCRWTHVDNPNDTLTPGNVTINVTTIPTAERMKIEATPIAGESAELDVRFRSNPPVPMKNVLVSKKNGNLFRNFFFKSNGINQGVLLYFPKVKSSDYGQYNITVIGQNQYCRPENVTFTAVLNKSPLALHPGYIVSITLGCCLLLVIIAIGLLFQKYRHGKKAGQISNSIQMAPAAKVSAPVSGHTNPSRSHHNQQYQHDTDDEFDTDDDAASRDVDDRPPMPVPPPPRKSNYEPSNSRMQPPPSPIPQRYQQQNLPPPRGINPPPLPSSHGTNPPPPPSPRGFSSPPLPPSHRVAVPPMRDVAPPPPPPSSRRPEPMDQNRGYPGYPNSPHNGNDPRTATLPQQRGVNTLDYRYR
uniref:uncharacterized protein LOC120336138 n=1 Tax=Styela clava TaxID=7725 RepID=UPI00193AB2A5|nr:uncharacterized protein LOC120336138 [Styela clava]